MALHVFVFIASNLVDRLHMKVHRKRKGFKEPSHPAMILTASHLLRELRWVPPAVIIIGSMTPFLNQWVIIRVLTLPLPSRVYQRLEERLNSNYQAVVGFFYEIWSGVEV